MRTPFAAISPWDKLRNLTWCPDMAHRAPTKNTYKKKNRNWDVIMCVLVAVSLPFPQASEHIPPCTSACRYSWFGLLCMETASFEGVFSITWFLGAIWALWWHTVYLTSWPMRSDDFKTGKHRYRCWFLLDMHIHFAINSHSAFECPRGSTMHLWMLPKEDLREIWLDAVAFENPRTSKPKITKLQFTLNKVKLFGIFRNYSKLCLKITRKCLQHLIEVGVDFCSICIYTLLLTHILFLSVLESPQCIFGCCLKRICGKSD